MPRCRPLHDHAGIRVLRMDLNVYYIHKIREQSILPRFVTVLKQKIAFLNDEAIGPVKKFACQTKENAMLYIPITERRLISVKDNHLGHPYLKRINAAKQTMT